MLLPTPLRESKGPHGTMRLPRGGPSRWYVYLDWSDRLDTYMDGTRPRGIHFTMAMGLLCLPLDRGFSVLPIRTASEWPDRRLT